MHWHAVLLLFCCILQYSTVRGCWGRGLRRSRSLLGEIAYLMMKTSTAKIHSSGPCAHFQPPQIGILPYACTHARLHEECIFPKSSLYSTPLFVECWKCAHGWKGSSQLMFSSSSMISSSSLLLLLRPLPPATSCDMFMPCEWNWLLDTCSCSWRFRQ